MSGKTSGKDWEGAEQTSQPRGDDFLVVGLGASAGGIKAFKEFFAHVPRASGMAYVVILHLSPEHESHLAEVLQTVTEMPVEQVRGPVRIEPNHVYVIPPNKSLAMNDGQLALSEVKRIEERRAPVDIFFRTLADSKHSRAVSVVLSGTGADGSMGMKRVKEMGGICVVQDPQEAEYSDMPRHSIATGLVDYVLPVAEIPQKIIAYSERLGQTRVPVESLEQPETHEQALRQIFTQLRVRTGHDFSNYKRATVLRRIERRINVNELSDLQAYAHFMRERPEEAQALLKDLLISVTNFFRDSEAFETLERGLIRRIFEGKGAGDQVRVWVAGCATGEEAYTMAMLLAEFTESLTDAPTVQVFATDIDEDAIARAREGFYTEADVADISPERLRRFFTKEIGGYRVRHELREVVLFAHHNLIKDPPFSHLDLASCRNLLIYLNRAAQERVMQVLHFALNPGGFLFLGTSESVDGSTDLFLTIDKEAHIYQSRAVAARLALPIPDLSVAGHIADLRRRDERVRETRALERISYADLHQRLVEQYAPPSVVVNEEYDIVHLSERAGRYMQVAGGEPSHNLLKIVRPEIRMELRTALYQARQNRAAVEARNIPVHLEEGMRLVNLQVRPVFSEGDNARGFILVVFDDAGGGTESAGLKAAEMVVAAEPAAQQLEDELVRVKAQLRATIQQYETQTEELKASNEELQAMNEELRSTAEELETSREELQSVNEELTTVNQELKIKIEELSQANDDFINLMNSTDIGTIFLDRTLRLKLFTPRARDIFNLIPADVGRPLSDITARLDAANLLADPEHVLASLQPLQREVETREGRWYLMNISPYRTVEDRIEGVILTFLDITERKLSEKDRFFLASIVESSEDAIITVDFGGEITSWNKAAEGLYGYAAAEAIGKPLSMLTLPEDLKEVLKNADKVRHSETVESYDTIRVHKDGREMNLELVLSPVREATGRVIGVSAIARDVTERRRAEALLQASEERLRLLIESVTDYSIIIQDMDGRIEVWNPGAERMFDYTQAEAVGQSIEIIFTPEDRAQGAHLAEMKTAREQGVANDERWHLRKDGSRFYVSGVLTLLRDGGLMGYAKIARDLTESKRTEEELRRARAELELRVVERTSELAEANRALRVENAERRQVEKARLQLLRQLVRVQDDERRRIARDIHDHLGQQSTALRLQLEALKDQCKGYEELCGPIEQTQEIAARLDADVDFLAWELRPAALDDLGLAATLGNFVKEWSKHFQIPADFHTSGMDEERPSPEVETSLYRIAQEALNNACKHAQASGVNVLLERRDHSVMLIVEDNGVGFDPSDKEQSEKGLGLLGMRERAGLVGGSLEIESAPNEGTTIFARVPVIFPEEGVTEG
ncbi:MAG TPA: PAS domain S-box protein [Pyrinomonadaceae bacterium]|jgi:two-component system CheB/CheR fusion protein|nr:PAS domain S-box protein [Pyrinomonadaceae bacterium]